MDFGYIMVVLMRASVLGLIVFYATTAIPVKEISVNNRIIISVIVVTLYALLDYFAGFFRTLRGLFCRAACGCSPYSNAVDLSVDGAGMLAAPTNVATTPDLTVPAPSTEDVSPKVNAEIEEAIAQLQSATADTKVAAQATQAQAQDQAASEKEEGEQIKQKAEAEAQSATAPKPNDTVTEGFALF